MIANGRKRKNLITKIMVDGTEMSNFEEIASAASRYFETLYTRDSLSRPRIDNLFTNILPIVMAESLEGPFMEEEIKVVVFSMDKNKSLGPNGFSMGFF